MEAPTRRTTTVPARRGMSGARWGWLITTLALGAGLGIASWANYRSARDAVSTLHLGQAGAFETVLMGAMMALGRGGAAPDLDSLVAAHSEAGLRFVGMLSEEEGLTVLGGDPHPLPFELPRRPQDPNLVQAGDRIRAFLPGPPGRPGGPGGRSGPRTHMVMEFEPLVASQLVDRAGRSLLLGALSAGLLMLMAFFFWRASVRREAEARIMEEQRRLSTLGELSAVLAHEIRNPLASLKGHAQLLAERTAPEAPDRGKVERIVKEAERLEALTTDLLDFVRTGPLDLQPAKVEDLLRRVAAEGGDGLVEVDASGAPDTWLLDPERMHQVLQNLLRNAEEAAPAGAVIQVKAAREGRSLALTFRDQGEGLPEENLERIFEPFFTTRVRGTGLGLAVARRIVELHGGTLTARNHPGGGAEFRLTLPEPGS
jgi:two-component system, NtrC family, sensor histidine kinase HydH